MSVDNVIGVSQVLLTKDVRYQDAEKCCFFFCIFLKRFYEVIIRTTHIQKDQNLKLWL